MQEWNILLLLQNKIRKGNGLASLFPSVKGFLVPSSPANKIKALFKQHSSWSFLRMHLNVPKPTKVLPFFQILCVQMSLSKDERVPADP